MLRRSLLLAALTLVAQGALAKDWDSIRFATEGAYPPFNMVDTQGEVQGFEVDISNALCEQMKARCTWVKQEWDGMIPALLSRKFDAIAASMSMCPTCPHGRGVNPSSSTISPRPATP